MNVFEETCLRSCEKWADSFPSDIPEHKFSKEHNDRMSELLNTGEKTHKYKPSAKMIKVFFVAAVLLSLTVSAFAIPVSREFIVEKFSNHSEYNVADTDGVKEVTPLKLNYVPAGFEKTEESASYGLYACSYKNNNQNFNVEKCTINAGIGYDTEKYDDEIININGIEAIYFRPDDETNGLIFNNGEYIFVISGNIGKEELVKIAQNVE